ncbi:hypothetical protein PSTT_00847 [Puccinia striiformis]|uniref:Uncharacterized protein n=4 Tax=Puccinia striiformis TaxID=27350 RepID=A0A2S4W5M8_9BASI|nr:hypothetical protein PSTT_00847 [Puccinia striiformis]
MTDPIIAFLSSVFLIIGSDMLKQLVLLSFWYVFVGSGVDAHPMNRALVKDGTVDSAFHLDVPVSTREFHGIGGVRSPGETSDELVDHGLIVSDQAHPLIGPVSPGHTTEGNTRLRDLLATVKSSKVFSPVWKIFRKWTTNPRKLDSLVEGVDTLWNKHSQITERFVTGPNSGMLTSDRMAILDEAQERIGVLQQLKLLEIEKITPNIANRQLVEEIFRFGPTPAKRLNLDSIDLSSKEEVQRLVNLHLEEVKKLLLPHTYNPKLSDRFIEPPSEKEIRQYWFYTVDFLLDNNFITEQDVRKIFQEEKIAEQTVMYYIYCFMEESQNELWSGLRYFTDHWFFASVPKSSFKVLGFKEKRIIDFSFLVKKLRIFGARFSYSVHPIQELDQFLEAFQIEKYLKNLDYSNKPKNVELIHNEDIHSQFKEDVKKLISLMDKSFVGSADNLGLSLTISEILNFIENELYAGLVKEAALELLGDEEKVKQFEDKAQLILNYFEFFKIHALPAASGAIKFTMQDKKEKLLKVFTIFNQVAHRILNRNDDWSRQIDGVLRLKSVLEVVEQLNRQMHLEENIRDVPPMSSRAKEVSEHAFSMAMTTSAISGALGAVSELTR